MKKLILLFSVFFVFSTVHAQKHDNIWMSGYQSFTNNPILGITVYDFSGDSLQFHREDRKMNFVQTHGVMCDSTGKLLFYSNGMFIANITHDTMLNGSGINPGFWHDEWLLYTDHGYRIRDGMIIVPDLKQSNYYKLFHVCLPEFNGGLPLQLLTTTVDMNGDNGLGAVIEKNSIVFQESGMSLNQTHFDAVRHANGRDWWLVNMIYDSKELLLHLYTPDSIFRKHTQVLVPHSKGGVGELQFSPDGSMLAITEVRIISTAKAGHSLHLYAFDRCSGEFAPIVDSYVEDTIIFNNGVIFSPSGRYLYQTYDLFVFRYDLEAGDILGSKDTIATWDGYTWYPWEGSPKFHTWFGYGELGPDGNIYIMSASASPFIHKITHPDDPSKSEVIQRIPIPTANAWTVPNYPNYRLGAMEGSPCAQMLGPPMALFQYEAESLDVDFEDFSAGVPLQWRWDFGDGDTSELQHPQHTYAISGTYTICLTASNIYGSDTQCQEVKVETTGLQGSGVRPQGFAIQPNPARGEVQIRWEGAQGQVTLLDAGGRVVAQMAMRDGLATPSLQHLPAGVYTVRVTLDDGRVHSETLMVQ